MKPTIVSVFILSFFLSCDRKEELPPPNVLWIVSEDNSPFLGAYGDEFATTPVLDDLARKGILYENAFAAAPVCAPSRSTLITGMHAPSLGTQHMRSQYPVPEFVQFYPHYLKSAGYYCTNNSKKDYNTVDQPEVWHESSRSATFKNRAPGQPFFHIQNFGITHESRIHDSIPQDLLIHDPEEVPIPPYHPRTEAMKHDWAQYYDRVQQLDSLVGNILAELEATGLADSTIVFYYSDHGGVLGRSKRFMFESGLRVPLIIYFPEMYRHLAPAEAGTKTDRVVSFVDFPATLLSLVGIEIPDYMQGIPFLGVHEGPPRDYAYSFRGRMDERIDMVRSLRSKEYRYVRNYMPHRIYGQFIEYLWRAPSMRSWERAWLAGELNEAQSKFWKTKPAEELYKVSTDPHNVINLADDPAYVDVLREMRAANESWLKEIRDVGFLPEAMMWRIAQDTPLYDYVRDPDFPFEDILHAADIATSQNSQYLPEIMNLLDHQHPAVRFWAVTGCVILGQDATQAKEKLLAMNQDPEPSVRVAVAEALYNLGETKIALDLLTGTLSEKNLMVRVQALNVLYLMVPAARPALEKVKQVIARAPQTREYDIRAAKRLVLQFRDNR